MILGFVGATLAQSSGDDKKPTSQPAKEQRGDGGKGHSLIVVLSGCYKPKEPSDKVFKVIDWTFHAAYVGKYPDGHYINYFTFTYSPSDDNSPCKSDAVGGQVCDHDVADDTNEGMGTCKFLTQDKQITQIQVRAGSIRAIGADVSDCTCP